MFGDLYLERGQGAVVFQWLFSLWRKDLDLVCIGLRTTGR